MWCILAVVGVLAVARPSQGFNVGVKGTKCNLDPAKGDLNDPCGSLYDAVCAGKHCACPAGTSEDKALGRCTRSRPGGSQGTSGGNRGAVDDLGLPLDYEPNKPALAPAPVTPKSKTPVQPQPGYNPNQPGYNPNQPDYNPNQPGYNPNQPGYNNPKQPGTHGGTTKGKGNDSVKEEVGGGVGGFLFLLIMGGIIYFCCCKGGKHGSRQVMNRFQGLPFMSRGQQQAVPGGALLIQSAVVQQDPNFSSQHTYVPPDAQQFPPGQYPPPAGVHPASPYAPQPAYAPYPPQGVGGPPMQPYPPQPYPPPAAAPYIATDVPQGYPPAGQQPPPYTQQYQPNAPPPQ